MSNYRIVTVVVTFNRKKELLNNIKFQEIQKYPIHKIIIIDNASSDGTEEYLHSNGYLNNPKVVYKKLPENIGGAGGFEEGVRLAMTYSPDFICLMDDDGHMINEDTLSNLVIKIPQNNNLVMINSLVTCDEEHLSFNLCDTNILDNVLKKGEEGLIAKQINPFNGTLISSKLVEEIGYPNGQLFIRGDESDYRRRAEHAGAYIATVLDSKYYHPSMASFEHKKWFRWDFVNNYDQPWKEYYEMRNYTYSNLKESKWVAYRAYFLRIIGTYIFKIKNRSVVLKYMRLGFMHGMRGQLGKVIAPGENDYFTRKGAK